MTTPGRDDMALIEAGNQLAASGDHGRAVEQYRRAAAWGSPIAAFNLGNSLMALGRRDEATKAFRQAAELGEKDAWLNLAWCLHDLMRYEDAVLAAKEAIAAGDSQGWNAFGAALIAEKGPRETLRVLMTEVDRGEVGAMTQVAHIYRDMGMLPEALSFLERAVLSGDLEARGLRACWKWDATRDLALEPELRAAKDHYDGARVDLAALLRETGRADEARLVLQEGVARGELASYLPLGNLHWDEFDDFDAAEEAYRAGILAGDRNCYHNLGLLLVDRGEESEGLAMLTVGAELGDELSAAVIREREGGQ